MNKIKSLVSAVSVVVLTVPGLAMAQFSTTSGTGLGEGSVSGIIKNVMNWLLMMVGILGVIGFAIAGILYLTAAGDDERIKQAKSAMIYSIIGVVVAMLGMVILRAVSTMLAGSSTTF